MKLENKNITAAHIYIDDIVFGSFSSSKKDNFVKSMQDKFEMRIVGELTYFLGLQVKTIYITHKICKEFGLKIQDGNFKRGKNTYIDNYKIG